LPIIAYIPIRIRITVPHPIPIAYQILPISLSLAKPRRREKSYAMPATRKKIEPYLERPDVKHPAYIEFRIGDYQHELGIIDSKYAPKKRQRNREVRLFTGMSIM
jgi:hypothetical protein